ncbi:MAG: hypothetical protein CME34_03050 [Gordonia sp.]|uniref:hypothetical protein n=1 Tax=Gordonia sp. (in: high G+C Gram-positive bacteria) TaxID=84139 RepID=UPI000C414FF6|nr:hypothetical protein [Gordonia sp. (in: high G+C Gram-positive bacteria)]MAU80847.1 hypothetical protein [Gordonia sp. (in: high G+C Gram-positive bacteria)]
MTYVHTTSPAHRRRPATHRALVVCTALVAAATIAAGCSQTSPVSIDEFAADQSPTLPALPAISPITCDRSSAEPGETVTRDAGGHDTPIDAVAAYHYAVITTRDPSQVAAAVAPGQSMGSPALIEAAFDGFPAGTTYCLRMRQTDATTVLATLDYQPPAAPPAQYKVRATTTGAAGQIRLTGEVDQ